MPAIACVLDRPVEEPAAGREPAPVVVKVLDYPFDCDLIAAREKGGGPDIVR